MNDSSSSISQEDLDALLQGSTPDKPVEKKGMVLDSESLNVLASSATEQGRAAGVDVGSMRPDNADLLMDVLLSFTVELGHTEMHIKEIMQLKEGSIVELDKDVGDEVDILVNDRPFGRGKLVALGEYLGVQITHIINHQQRRREFLS